MTQHSNPTGTIDNCPYCDAYTKPGDVHMVCRRQPIPSPAILRKAEEVAATLSCIEGDYLKSRSENMKPIIAAALSEQQDRTQWQPMDTAPKNIPVLVWANNRVYYAIQQQYYQWHWIGSRLCSGGSQADFLGTATIEPEAWMPLPEPPRAAVEGAIAKIGEG